MLHQRKEPCLKELKRVYGMKRDHHNKKEEERLFIFLLSETFYVA